MDTNPREKADRKPKIQRKEETWKEETVKNAGFPEVRIMQVRKSCMQMPAGADTEAEKIISWKAVEQTRRACEGL